MPDIKTYTITQVDRRDEWPSRYGPMQDYAISLEGEEGWHKLTQKPETKPPQVGEPIEGYIEPGTNTNGTAYKKFKKQSAEYAGRTESTHSQNTSGSQESYIVQMLEELTGRRDVVDQVHDVPDEPLKDPFEGMNI